LILLKKVNSNFGYFGIKTKRKAIDKYFGVVVTEIIKRKFGKVCHIYIMTGKQRTKWQHLITKVEDFAKQEDCKMMELIARPGWQRVLDDYGYKRTHVVLEKQIKQEITKYEFRRRIIRWRYNTNYSNALRTSRTSISTNII
jgi:hypothetical protein